MICEGRATACHSIAYERFTQNNWINVTCSGAPHFFTKQHDFEGREIVPAEDDAGRVRSGKLLDG